MQTKHPLPRRNFLALPLISPFISMPLMAFGKGDFWERKQPSDWTDEEVQRLLTKSPWSKEAILAMDPASLKGGTVEGGPGGKGLGGPPPPFGGAQQGQLPPVQNVPIGRNEKIQDFGNMRATVRWDSAEPMRAVLRQSAVDTPDYILSVSGFPTMSMRNAAPEERAAMLDDMRGGINLEVKDRAIFHPYDMKREASGSLVMRFSRAETKLTMADKDAFFTMRAGSFIVKVRFVFKDMMYKGKLAL